MKTTNLLFFVTILVTLVYSSRGQHVFNNFSYQFGIDYRIDLNDTTEYIFNFAGDKNLFDFEFPARISVMSSSANKSFPIFVTARQRQGSQSWQLPFVVGNIELSSVSKTLCPNAFYIPESKQQGLRNIEEKPLDHPIIHLYTSSSTNLSVNIRIDLVRDFFLKLYGKRDFYISPSEPRIFYYNFEPDLSSDSPFERSANMFKRSLEYKAKEFNLNSPETTALPEINEEENQTDIYENIWNRTFLALKSSVMTSLDESMKTVVINLDSEDDTCMLISIQNASCPVFDNEREIAYDGLYATISKSGGVRVTQRKFPHGFFMVLVVKSSNEECSGFPDNSSISRFSSFFEWKIQDFDSPMAKMNPNNSKLKRVKIEINPSISYREYWLATFVVLVPIIVMYISSLICFKCMKSKPKAMSELEPAENVMMNQTISPASFNSLMENFNSNYGITQEDCSQTVVYLSQLCKKKHSMHKNSALYLWNLVTVAVFYGLPVIQLVITYQRVLNRTGDQDLCYYNFLCAHSLGGLSDFNHVYSNIAYILLGALFIYLVRHRQKEHKDATFDRLYGIPQHYGLFYAMGVSLIMEGILSASYHVCPNRSNFQFDTSFMYTMAVICMVKIYQSRHPDVNARAHTTFSVLAISIFICLLGVLFPNVYFWIFFTFVHIFTCLAVSLEIYYMGYWKIGMCCIRQCFCGGICKPLYKSQCIFLLIANICNWSLAGFGLYMHSKDFASHLLYIFLLNLALHFGFYITMKTVHGEKPPIYVWILIVAALIVWGFSLKFFFAANTSWALTPAQSRTYNRPCDFMSFFDDHDIWHILSAFALFLSFLVLLFLDDDITHKSREKIPVF